MPDTRQVKVLLADGDSLRRDGLAAILKANSEIDVVAGCPDGQTTLEAIRDLRPDVAVVDLNLPGLHGIELTRRVRGESLGTKVVVVAGTMDDEIVREVVRAGGDGYVLKDGPARHLMDAINYVRDGGQYFSPQLGRDGRDRHLVEEPPRVQAGPADGDSERREDNEFRSEGRRRKRRVRPRTSDPGRFRERLREEGPRDLRDRDYEIMSEMADGIRPILDRLDEIEGRVVEMEAGEERLPADPRSWLTGELAGSLDDSHSPGSRRERGAGVSSSRDIEARLPQMIEEAVTRRFHSMAGKLQTEIEEQHIRTLETFVKNIQVKLVQRVSALEQNMSHQAEAMHQLREYNQRTEDNLSRLITGVDRLATELPKRLAAAQNVESTEPPITVVSGGSGRSGADGRADKRGAKSSAQRQQKNPGPKIFWAVAAVAIVVSGGIAIHSRMVDSSSQGASAPGERAAKAAKETASGTAVPVDGTDTKTKLEAAKQYTDRKEYGTAEDIYKQVVQAEPNNEEALKGLASVLYREDKIEESAAVLDRLPKNGN